MDVIPDFAVRRGAVWRGWITIAEGSSVRVPVIHIAGAKPGKTMLVTAGLHGDEYDGLEAALRLADETSPDDLAGHLVIVPRVNVQSFWDGWRWNSIDGLDMNRQFPGSPDLFLAQRLAAFLNDKMLPKADLVADLHGGTTQLVVVSYGGVYAPPSELPKIRRAMAVKHIWDWSTTVGMRGTFGNAAEILGIPLAVIEIGGGNTWTESCVQDALKGLRNLLRYNGQLDTAPEGLPGEQLLLRGSFIHASHEGFLRPKVKLGEWVKKGQTLAVIVSLLGEVVETVTSRTDGVVNDIRSSPNIRAGEWLYLVGELHEKLVYDAT